MNRNRTSLNREKKREYFMKLGGISINSGECGRVHASSSVLHFSVHSFGEAFSFDLVLYLRGCEGLYINSASGEAEENRVTQRLRRSARAELYREQHVSKCIP